jgi:hypothetical protein
MGGLAERAAPDNAREQCTQLPVAARVGPTMAIGRRLELQNGRPFSPGAVGAVKQAIS